MKIYCSHVWTTYVADSTLPYEFCHRCHSTFLPGQGLIKPEVEIGHTLTEIEEQTRRIIKSDFEERK